MILKKFIGDKAFYKRVLTITLPILLQNVITNFVSLIDNIMVGRLGTEQMSGVAIVNQLIMIFYLCSFGAISGAGIFTAQFYGKGDVKGVRHTFRQKMMLVLIISAVAEFIFIKWGSSLVQLFLHEGEEGISLAKTLGYAMDYIRVILISLPVFAVTQAYSDTLKSTGDTVTPMQASVVAVLVNMSLNYVLIFGKLGAPALGVTGAAIATITARFAECLMIVLKTHLKNEKYPFIQGAYKSLSVPKELWKSVAAKGFPLIVNETMWSLGMTAVVQAYSYRGIEVVSALNISTTVSNLFNCAFLAIGSAISIMVGQLLGAGQLEKARDEDNKLIFCSVASCVVIGGIMAAVSPLIPEIYNTTDKVKEIACTLLIISAVLMPIHSFTHASYFTLRSGGKVVVTFLFDSVYLWCISIPAAYLLSRLTPLPIIPLYVAVQMFDVLKAFVGFFLVKSGVWVNNLVVDKH
ncbi:MAG: MATE family efflux transporter [Clostridia bacterium]|nr:MATE family efflux transporter [Clostridia bacterium]